jgi:hypothetical protein
MMIPQDFIHLNLLSSSGSFLGIKNLNGLFGIRQIRLDLDGL